MTSLTWSRKSLRKRLFADATGGATDKSDAEDPHLDIAVYRKIRQLILRLLNSRKVERTKCQKSKTQVKRIKSRKK